MTVAHLVAAPATTPVPRVGMSPKLRLIACGSVDDGKSTLIGRLLWDSKTVTDDQAEALIRDAGPVQNDLGLPDFALLLDGLQAEREQGITIDVAYRFFSTRHRSCIVADTPGHEDYTRNMATGASTADLAILLVDARTGLMQQTRRHAAIVSLMGIRQVVLAVNKMDLAAYAGDRFDVIAAEFREFAFALGISDVVAIPVSALRGENVVTAAVGSMPWYSGPTLIEALDRAVVRSERAGGFRFPVQRISRPHEGFRGYQGTIAGGAIKPGDRVIVQPAGSSAIVERIVTFDLERNAGVAGEAVTLVLDRPIDVARGDMLVGPEAPPMIGTDFEADLVSLSAEGIVAGVDYWLQSATRRQKVTIWPDRGLDLDTGQYDPADHVPLNGIGKVRLSFREPAIFDPYGSNRTTGAFILVDPVSRNTIAGGMIVRMSSTPTDLAAPSESDRVVLSLPNDLARKFLASDEVAGRRDEIRVFSPLIARGQGPGTQG